MTKLEQLLAEYCPEGVEYRKLGEVCETVTPPKKINSKFYQEKGKYPIIDQGQSIIVGYCNDDSAVLSDGKYVLFGDHTLEIKYFDGKFAQGADGLKILRAKECILPRYLFHAMLNFKVQSRGYSRH